MINSEAKIVFTSALCVAVVLSGCSGSAVGGGEGDSTGPVKIGLTTALSGNYAEFGAPMKNSAELAIERFNSETSCERKVELVSYDDQLVAETAQANMRRLLDDDQVDFVLAPAGSGPTLAVLPLVNAKDKIFMNSLAQTSTIVTPEGEDKPYPNVFSFALGNEVESDFMATGLVGQYDKVALIGESTPYGETGLELLAQHLKDGGVEVVAQEGYDQKATDVTAQLARIKRGQPDAVAFVGLGNDTATVREGMSRLDMLETPFLVSMGGGTVPYQNRAKRLVEGTQVVHYKAFSGDEPTGDLAQEFSKAYAEKFGNDAYYGKAENPVPSFGMTPAGAFDAIYVLLNAYEKAGCKPETGAVRDQLQSGEKFVGARGEYSFSAEDHEAVTTDLLVFRDYLVDGESISFADSEN